MNNLNQSPFIILSENLKKGAPKDANDTDITSTYYALGRLSYLAYEAATGNQWAISKIIALSKVDSEAEAAQ